MQQQPKVSPQVLATLGQSGGATPGMGRAPAGFGGSRVGYQPPPAPGNPIPPPMGAPNPNLQAFGQSARMTPDEMAAKGRLGDRVVAHLAPGEITVPPEIQTPEVMQVLQSAFAKVGAPIQQFTVGSPSSSVNPETGAPEYSLWSALLPVVGAALGSFIPGVGTAAGMAIGGGVGGAAGGALSGGGLQSALLGALGGAGGGYLGGGGLGELFGSAGEGALTAAEAAGPAANVLPQSAANTGNAFGVGLNPELGYMAQGATSQVANPTTTGAGLLSSIPWKGSLMAGLGATLADSFAPPPQVSAQPAGFNQPMPPLNRNYNQILGNPNSPTPNFQNYNPYQSVTGGGYNFFAPRVA